MVEVIPTILVRTEALFRERLAAVEPFAPWVQLDVVDGKFAPNVTWGEPTVIAALTTELRFEIDLMVADPESAVAEWLSARRNIGRILFHVEAAEGREHQIIDRIAAAGLEVGMSLNPETPIEKLEPFLPRLDAVMLLGVSPGFSGQEFQEYVIEKVAKLRQRFPTIPIEVDGGVNVSSARRLVASGATRLASGSFIFNHPKGPGAAIRELREAAAES